MKEFDIDSADIKSLEEFLMQEKPYGWVIEMDFHFETTDRNGNRVERNTGWEVYWNHKLYKTEEIAKEAVSHIEKGFSKKTQFRIFPLYKKTNVPETTLPH